MDWRAEERVATKRSGDGTAIEWTHVPGYKGVSWNPTVGCTRVSAGCDNCYAFALHDKNYAANLRLARQLGYQTTEESRADPTSHPPFPAQYDRPFSQVQVMDDRIEQPLHWRDPRAVFVDSMADVFHEDVSDEVLDRIFAAMALASRHIFMILTKRPARMRDYIRGRTPAWLAREFAVSWHAEQMTGGTRSIPGWPLPNVWLGTSVENQAAAESRIPVLMETPAAVRFLSCEPLLGPVDLQRWMGVSYGDTEERRGFRLSGGGDGRVEDRRERTHLESGITPGGSLEPGHNEGDSVYAEEGGARGYLPQRAGDDRWQKSDGSRPPDGMEALQWPDTVGADGESQGRDQEQERSKQPRTRDTFGTDDSRSARSWIQPDSEPAISWVIVGGESGSHRRPMDEDWARRIRDDCARAGTAFFYKQTSAQRPGQAGPPDLQEHKAFPPLP